MLDNTTKKRIKIVLPQLNESQKRRYLAAEAESLGRGGITAISEFTGVCRKTISTGIQEKREAAGHQGETLKPQTRIRAKGAGRKPIETTQPGIIEALEQLVDGSSFGNPENPLRWTTKSLHHLEGELKGQGFKISHTKVGELLKQMGFSLQMNRKMNQVGKESPDRNAQFEHINHTAAAYIADGQPVISIDCKKKENVGNFKNNGAEYAPKGSPMKVLDHDFPLPEKGKAIPYGVYDLASNEGYVNIGISADTASFAVQSIRTWWNMMGKERFPEAERLYITADGGGSNGSRCRLWKMELQKLADELNIPIEVSHFPPGTSKWNKIEHRMFSQISKNWRGRPLESLEVIINLISSTTTKTGLTIKCGLDEKIYQTGIKISKSELSKINLVPNAFLKLWNYTIFPAAYSCK